MPLAAVNIRRGDRGAAPIPADDVTTRFEAVICEHGPVGVPIDCRSWSQIRQAVGDHTAYSTLRAAERHLIEGGSRVVLSRVVGPAARAATVALRDGSAGTVITWTAEGPGSYYHAVTFSTRAAVGSDQEVTVKFGGAVLASAVVSSAAAAIDLINAVAPGRATLGAGTWPLEVVTDRAAAGGDDDRANIRDPHVETALAAFRAEYVEATPGSLCASAWTSVATHTALAQHAAATNRFARGDMPDVSSAATLIAHGRQIRALNQTAGDIQLLAGYPTVTIAGVTIPVAPSGFLTGREARTDAENKAGPGQPCAWTYGEFASAEGVTNAWSASDREAMLDAGITIIVSNQGAVFAEDAITAADPVRYPQFAEVSGRRVVMAIHSQARAAMRPYVRRTLDGHGHTATACRGDLIAICSDWYGRDALYGDQPEEAFEVAVQAEVRPGFRPRLVGSLTLRPSPSVQTVDLTITAVAASDTI